MSNFIIRERELRMKIKDGVNIQGLNIHMRPVLIAADELWGEHGEELVVTSGLEGTHSAGSLHYYGRAVDLRTRYFSDATKYRTAGKLYRKLGREYDIVVHRTHIHVEYDPRKGVK